MAESKADLEQRVQQLEEDNDRLRGQLAAAGARPASVAPAPFVLTEGDRQQLEATGFATIGGRVLLTEEVRELLGADSGVEIRDVSETQRAAAESTVRALRVGTGAEQQGIRGVTHVWPSVEPGGIDPAVAGTPGISGPAAGSDVARLARQTPAPDVPTGPPASS